MKYQYNRPVIKIDNWLVSQKNIEQLNLFFKKRFSLKEVPISLKTESGNHRDYDSYDEFLSDLPKLAAEKEVVKKIEFSYRVQDDKNYHCFKQIWIDIDFGQYGGATFHIVAGDVDESYKDWVDGSYNDMLKLKGLFEMKNEKEIALFQKRFPSKIGFDPDEVLRKKIETQVHDEDKKSSNTSLESAHGRKKDNFLERITNNQLFATTVGALIVFVIIFLIYYFTGLNLSSLGTSQNLQDDKVEAIQTPVIEGVN